MFRRFTRLLFALLLIASLQTSALAQRGLKSIPDPDPELERKTFKVPEGFEVQLYASDPLIAKPIHMNFDAQGRLWIASSEVYPQIKPGQKATDKILVVEDADGDGRAEKTTVFAGGLLIPTGVLPGDGGAYIANSTEILHMTDTDGDGKADKKRIVLSGFGTEDTHHIIHTFRWGMDGLFYFNQSIYIHSFVETPHGPRQLRSGGIWAFRPETMKLEVFCRGFVNTWGHDQDQWGQSFATDGAYGEGINYVFPGSVFVTYEGAKRVVKGLNPGSPKHCGLAIVDGRHLPPEWTGNMITNDFRAHRVNRFVLKEDGSGYSSRQQPDLITSSHPAFRPIDVKMGPDGAIYVADWYNPIIQHGEVDFRDPRRDHTHGRIWRITAKGRPLVEKPRIVGASIDQLLELLKAPESFTRLHAKQELKRHKAEDVTKALAAWVGKLDAKDPQFEQLRLEAIWAYQTINQPEPALLARLLASKDHRVRAAAIRVQSEWRDRLPDIVPQLAGFVIDEHPRVRLEAVRSLSLVPQAQAAEIAAKALDKPLDQFLDFALWQTMRDLAPHWLPSLTAGRSDFGGNIAHLQFALKSVESPAVVQPLLALLQSGKLPAQQQLSVLSSIATLGGPQQLASVFEIVAKHDGSLDAARRAALLTALVEQTQLRRLKPAGDLAGLAALVEGTDVELAAAGCLAAGAWKVEALRPTLAALADSSRKSEPGVRLAAIAGLASLGGKPSIDVLDKLASANNPADIQQAALTGLTTLDVNIAAKLTADRLAALPADGNPAALIEPFFQLKEGPTVLAKALAGKKLQQDVALRGVRAVRLSPQPQPDLIAALNTAGGLSAGPRVFSKEDVQKLLADVPTRGDAGRGEQIFRRGEMACLKCHAIGGAGGRVGPDMASLGAASPVDYILESLLDPNAKIKENFHAITLITDEGKIFSGVKISQTPKEYVIRDAEDKLVVVPVASVEQMKEGKSIMPAGLIDSLTRDELIDLTRFLSELGKGPYAVGNKQVVRRWESLIWTADAHKKLNRTSLDAAAGEDPAFTWQSVYSRVGGDLPLANLARFKPHNNIEPTVFVRFQIDVTTAGRVRLNIGSITGLQAWLDGKPVTLKEVIEAELTRGPHVFTFAVTADKRPEPLRVELLDTPDSPARAQIVTGK